VGVTVQDQAAEPSAIDFVHKCQVRLFQYWYIALNLKKNYLFLKSLKRFRFQMIFFNGWSRKQPALKVTCDKSGGNEIVAPKSCGCG